VPPRPPHVLLVNPWIHDFAAYDGWAKPLGLLTIASLLRSGGCRVSYLDCLDRFHPRAAPPPAAARFGCGPYHKTPLPKPAGFGDVPRRFSRYGIDPDWLRADLDRMARPDLILVTSAMTYWHPGVAETIAALKTAFPGAPVVLGGAYATLCPEHARRWSGADAVFTGPVEDSLATLVETHTGRRPAAAFDPEAPDTWPFPAFDLQRRIPYVPLLTSRGCPYRCAYCASHLLEPRRTRRSPGSVLAEIAHWHRGWGVTDVVLYDDAFLADLDGHAVPVLEAIRRAGLPVRLHTPNALHVRGITEQSARLLFQAGFASVRLGLETTDFDLRAGLDHKVARTEFEAACAKLGAAGFGPARIGAYLLVGLPGQSTDSILRSIDLVKQAGASPLLAYYSPIPGTRLWPAAVRSARYDLAADPLFTNNSVLPCRLEFDWAWLAALRRRVTSE
jgi:radical SAM superfamily enzyme YgiQ (UPF0313 family)